MCPVSVRATSCMQRPARLHLALMEKQAGTGGLLLLTESSTGAGLTRVHDGEPGSARAGQVAAARHAALFQRFIAALTRGGPGGMPRPIEMHAHDPRRYLGDTLAWVHQVGRPGIGTGGAFGRELLGLALMKTSEHYSYSWFWQCARPVGAGTCASESACVTCFQAVRPVSSVQPETLQQELAFKSSCNWDAPASILRFLGQCACSVV